jgi:hypothetical protein
MYENSFCLAIIFLTLAVLMTLQPSLGLTPKGNIGCLTPTCQPVLVQSTTAGASRPIGEFSVELSVLTRLKDPDAVLIEYAKQLGNKVGANAIVVKEKGQSEVAYVIRGTALQ